MSRHTRKQAWQELSHGQIERIIRQAEARLPYDGDPAPLEDDGQPTRDLYPFATLETGWAVVHDG